MKLEIIISIIAIVISLFSLFINFYKIHRDKSKLKVWAKIFYAEDFYSNLDDRKYYPVMQIFIVNAGLRPIIITDIGMMFKDKSVRYKHIKENDEATKVHLTTDDENIVEKIEKLFIVDNLSHKYSIKLDDGDIYEIRIKYDDYYEYIDFEKDAAFKVYIRDIFGNNHYVKNSRQCLKILNEYK